MHLQNSYRILGPIWNLESQVQWSLSYFSQVTLFKCNCCKSQTILNVTVSTTAFCNCLNITAKILYNHIYTKIVLTIFNRNLKINNLILQSTIPQLKYNQ